jgi:hypothetical protein
MLAAHSAHSGPVLVLGRALGYAGSIVAHLLINRHVF